MFYRTKTQSSASESEEEDGVPGAPVTELEYKHYVVMPYLRRLIWRHVSESGWYHEQSYLVPKTYQSWGWDFFISSWAQIK